MPLHDWQFWLVTLAALIAAVWLGRSVLRIAKPRKGRSVKTQLTIGGARPADKHRD